jgi:iron complex outermembrane receptor protein
MKKYNNALAAVLAASTAMVWTMPAMAQDAVTAEDSDAVQDIVVSARRRDETLQQTPLAITALSPAYFESTGSTSIADLQGVAPNLLITSQNTGAGAANASIRGIAFADVDKSFDPAIAVVIDGVVVGSSTGQLLDTFDLQSIEVLRGPQGTLFGRNTIGGVINLTRSRPTGEWGGKFEASMANYGTFTTRAVLNAPIVDGVLAAKLFYFHNETDGFYRNGISGKRVGGSNNENYGLSLRLTPSDNFDALLTLEKQEQSFNPINAPISKTGELFCLLAPANECNRNTTSDIYTVFGEDSKGNYSSPAATLEMNLDLGGIKLTSVTGYRDSKEDQTGDYEGLSPRLYYGHRIQDFKQLSQELRGAGNIGESFDYVVGLYYFDSKYTLNQETDIPPFGLTGANTTHQRTSGWSTSYAVFADLNWELTDTIRLSGGARWTHDKKSLETANWNGAIENPSFGKYGKSFSKFTPKVGIDWRPSDEHMLYASWSRGYRSGGFSGRGQTLQSASTPYQPETVDAYEVGLKSAFFDRKLQVNLAAFMTDYKDLQQSTTVPTTNGVGNETIVTNAGSAKIKGIELDFTAKPVRGLTLNGSVGYLSNKLKNFISLGSISPLVPGLRTIDYSNVNMIYAPKVTASINAEYTAAVASNIDWTSRIGYRYIAPYDQQIALDATVAYPITGTIVLTQNDPRMRSDRQGLLDLSTSLVFDVDGKKVRATVFGRNVTDDRGPNAAFTVAGLWSFTSGREPRTYGASLGFEF